MRPAFVALIALVLAEPAGAQVITTVAGGGSPNNVLATTVGINRPAAVATDAAGNVFIAAASGNRVYRVNPSGILTLAAGNGLAEFSGDGGLATGAGLNSPSGVAVDAAGRLFIADSFNHRIRQVDAGTGIITTVAGSALPGYSGDGGQATSAGLLSPSGVAVDTAGHLFIADRVNQRIRRVDLTTGIITTVAGTGTSGYSGDGGLAMAAALSLPQSVAAGVAGDLYIADTGNHRIRRVDSAGTITTVAGTGVAGVSGDGGPAISANLLGPSGTAIDNAGNLLIADISNRVRRVDLGTGIILTVAGTGAQGDTGDGGPAVVSTLALPSGVSADGAGNIFIADTQNNRVRRVAATGIITSLAGNGSPAYSGDGGMATAATLDQPTGVAADNGGHLFIADQGNQRIRQVDVTTGVITTVAGHTAFGYGGDGGTATNATLFNPYSVAVDAAGHLFIADVNNSRIRRVDLSTGTITTVAGNGSFGYGGDNGQATLAALLFPLGVAVDAGSRLFIADTANHRVRQVDLITGVITTVAGTGAVGYNGDGILATAATLSSPSAIAVDTAGHLFIADQQNFRIRQVDIATGLISTVAGTGICCIGGDGGPATSARLSLTRGLAVDAANRLFIADNQLIRQVDLGTGIITTVAGTGFSGFSGDGGPATSAMLANPSGLAVDTGGRLFVADNTNQRVRMVTLSTGPAITRAGFYNPVSSDASAVNTVKGGSTVPLKFKVFVDNVEKTDTAGLQFTVAHVPCGGGSEDPVDFVTTGGTVLRYDTNAAQFVQTWQTPKSPGACYVVRMTTTADGGSLSALFKMK